MGFGAVSGNWKASEKAGAGATIAPPNGVVATASDGNTVIYGVIIDNFQPQQAADLGAATRRLIGSIQQGNSGSEGGYRSRRDLG